MLVRIRIVLKTTVVVDLDKLSASHNARFLIVTLITASAKVVPASVNLTNNNP